MCGLDTAEQLIGTIVEVHKPRGGTVADPEPAIDGEGKIIAVYVNNGYCIRRLTFLLLMNERDFVEMQPHYCTFIEQGPYEPK